MTQSATMAVFSEWGSLGAAVTPWRDRERLGGYVWSASRNGGEYVSWKLWTIMLKKRKQKTEKKV